MYFAFDLEQNLILPERQYLTPDANQDVSGGKFIPISANHQAQKSDFSSSFLVIEVAIHPDLAFVQLQGHGSSASLILGTPIF